MIITNPYKIKLVNCCKQQVVVALELYPLRAKLRTKGISLQVQVVLIFALDNSNVNAGNVTKLHTFAKHRTNRNDLMYFHCITAC